MSVGKETWGKLSPLLYLMGIGAAFCMPGLAQLFYAAVALIWLVPDRRIERAFADRGGH